MHTTMHLGMPHAVTCLARCGVGGSAMQVDIDQLDQNKGVNKAGGIIGKFNPVADAVSTDSLQPYSEVQLCCRMPHYSSTIVHVAEPRDVADKSGLAGCSVKFGCGSWMQTACNVLVCRSAVLHTINSSICCAVCQV